METQSPENNNTLEQGLKLPDTDVSPKAAEDMNIFKVLPTKEETPDSSENLEKEDLNVEIEDAPDLHTIDTKAEYTAEVKFEKYALDSPCEKSDKLDGDFIILDKANEPKTETETKPEPVKEEPQLVKQEAEREAEREAEAAKVSRLTREDILRLYHQVRNDNLRNRAYVFQKDRRRIQEQMDRACIGCFLTVSVVAIVIYNFF